MPKVLVQFNQRVILRGHGGWYLPVLATVLVGIGVAGRIADGYLQIPKPGALVVMLVFTVLSIAIMVLAWRFINRERLYKYRIHIWVGIAMLITVLWVFTDDIVPWGSIVYHRGFNLGVVYVKTSSLVAPVVFALALYTMTRKDKTQLLTKLPALCLVIVALFLVCRAPLSIMLVASFALAVIALQALLEEVKDVSAWARAGIILVSAFVYTSAIGVLLYLFFFNYSYVRPEDIQAFLSAGKSCPFSSGWQYMQIDKYLAGSLFVGASDSPAFYAGYRPGSVPRGWWGEYPLVNIIVLAGRLPGLIVAALCLTLVVLLLITIWKSKLESRIVTTALACMLLLPMLATVLMNFNLFPVISLDVPFIGQSNLDLLLSCLALGVIAGMRRSELQTTSVNDESCQASDVTTTTAVITTKQKEKS